MRRQRQLGGASSTSKELGSSETTLPRRPTTSVRVRDSPQPDTDEEETLQEVLTYWIPVTFGVNRHEDIKMASSSRVPKDMPAPVDPASRTPWAAGMATNLCELVGCCVGFCLIDVCSHWKTLILYSYRLQHLIVEACCYRNFSNVSFGVLNGA